MKKNIPYIPFFKWLNKNNKNTFLIIVFSVSIFIGILYSSVSDGFTVSSVDAFAMVILSGGMQAIQDFSKQNNLLYNPVFGETVNNIKRMLNDAIAKNIISLNDSDMDGSFIQVFKNQFLNNFIDSYRKNGSQREVTKLINSDLYEKSLKQTIDSMNDYRVQTFTELVLFSGLSATDDFSKKNNLTYNPAFGKTVNIVKQILNDAITNKTITFEDGKKDSRFIEVFKNYFMNNFIDIYTKNGSPKEVSNLITSSELYEKSLKQTIDAKNGNSSPQPPPQPQSRPQSRPPQPRPSRHNLEQELKRIERNLKKIEKTENEILQKI